MTEAKQPVALLNCSFLNLAIMLIVARLFSFDFHDVAVPAAGVGHSIHCSTLCSFGFCIWEPCRFYVGSFEIFSYSYLVVHCR